MIANTIFTTVVFFLLLSSCSELPDEVNKALLKCGKRRAEFEKVIQHYRQLKEPLRLQAAYYLIEHLPAQRHFSGQMIVDYQKAIALLAARAETDSLFNRSFMADSLKKRLSGLGKDRPVEVSDMEVLNAEFLISNIDDAFTAWQYPWARHLSFREFCEYLLPYKVVDEYPELWRGYFQHRYSWLADSMDNKTDMMEACVLINQDLRKWFFFSKMSQPFDFSCSDLLTLRAGGCPEEAQLAAYAMRAMGIPVAMDGVPMWANRNSRHDWNALIDGRRVIPFMGAEADPGVYKVEGYVPGNVVAKRARIFRRCYARRGSTVVTKPASSGMPAAFAVGNIIDVTREYIPVHTLRYRYATDGGKAENYYLSVFNNLDWRIIARGERVAATAVFRNIGRDVVYLPLMYKDKELKPGGMPVIVHRNGREQYLTVDTTRMSRLVIDRKYPAGDDNKVQRGQRYELFYWKGKWISMGVQKAESDTLCFGRVPSQSLLWLHNLDEGQQERVFVYENNKIIWY